MSRAHLENMVGAALGLLGVIAAPLLAANDWAATNWAANDWARGSLPALILDALIWGAGALVLYLYGVRGMGGGAW